MSGESSSNSAETIHAETENPVVTTVNNNSDSLNNSTVGAIPNISVVEIPGLEIIPELVTIIRELKAESQSLCNLLTLIIIYLYR